MFEEFILVLLVIVIIAIIFSYSSRKDKKLLEDAERGVVSAKEKLKITERKYMQGKLRKGVFDSLVDDLEAELLSYELTLFRLRRSGEVSVEEAKHEDPEGSKA